MVVVFQCSSCYITPLPHPYFQSDGQTALYAAVANQHKDVVKILLEHNADVTTVYPKVLCSFTISDVVNSSMYNYKHTVHLCTLWVHLYAQLTESHVFVLIDSNSMWMWPFIVLFPFMGVYLGIGRAGRLLFIECSNLQVEMVYRNRNYWQVGW